MADNPSKMATGNLMIAVPEVRTSDGGILALSFLHMNYRAVVELHGWKDSPLLAPVIEVDGEPVQVNLADWVQESFWIPTFQLEHRGAKVSGSVIAPPNHRGLVYLLQIAADAQVRMRAGWSGSWGRTYHVTNLSKRMGGTRHGGVNARYGNTPYVEYRGAIPMFALAFHPSEEMELEVFSRHVPERKIKGHGDGEASAAPGQAICYSLAQEFTLQPGEDKSLAVYVGFGIEETSAVSSAVNLRRYGWNSLQSNLRKWLEQRTIQLDDPEFEYMLNANSFYNYFFSQGISLDTEDLVLMTSRSSKYHTSASYSDRDAMLWSLPAVLQIDPAQARKMIEYAFTTQLKNVGVHSRFIDGVVLEPGFELDELCAPIAALWLYVRTTGDMSILFDRRIQTGVNEIQQILSMRRHPKIALFETMLLPSDDPTRYPYVTYDNVRVWRVLKDLAWMYDRIRDLDRAHEAADLAEEVKRMIMQHCVVPGPYGPMFAWAVDLEGNHRTYDDPRGSLQLLPYLEFVTEDWPVYQNTIRWLHSADYPLSFAGCAFQAPGSEREQHPSVLAVANDLLTGRMEEALDFLRRSGLDEGIACESVDENTGRPVSGIGFASCAGYLAFALNHALRGNGAAATLMKPEPRPAERLYQPPPSEIADSSGDLFPDGSR